MIIDYSGWKWMIIEQQASQMVYIYIFFGISDGVLQEAEVLQNSFL